VKNCQASSRLVADSMMLISERRTLPHEAKELRAHLVGGDLAEASAPAWC
jgi:hypothetical protein